PHVQPDCRGARAAVVQEGYGSALRIFAILRIRDEKHPRGHFAVVETNGNRAGRRRVFDLAPIEPHGVRRRRRLLFSRAEVLLARLGCVRLRGGRRLLLLIAASLRVQWRTGERAEGGEYDKSLEHWIS